MFSLGSYRGILFWSFNSFDPKLNSILLFLSWSSDMTFFLEFDFFRSDFAFVMFFEFRNGLTSSCSVHGFNIVLCGCGFRVLRDVEKIYYLLMKKSSLSISLYLFLFLLINEICVKEMYLFFICSSYISFVLLIILNLHIKCMLYLKCFYIT